MRTAARISAPVFMACIWAMARSVRTAGFALDIAHLAADHAAGTGACGEFGDQADADRRFGVCSFGGEQPEGVGEQGVAGQDGGGVVIGPVHRRAAAAQVVVVHGRQVVVDQRIAVDHFDSEAGSNGGGGRDAEDAGGLADEQGPQALAAVEAAVAHGGDEPLGRDAGAGQGLGSEQRVECALDVGSGGGEFGGEGVGHREDPRRDHGSYSKPRSVGTPTLDPSPQGGGRRLSTRRSRTDAGPISPLPIWAIVLYRRPQFPTDPVC